MTIPVRLAGATRELSPAFHLIHRPCGTRIREQIVCPTHERVVTRDELVRGFEVEKGAYVAFTDEELQALASPRSRTIDIQAFVPLASVDPVCYDRAYHLTPGDGGEKAYGLLAGALAEEERVALATYVMRGKESPVAVRSRDGRLMLHTMFFADEIRETGGRPAAAPRPAEMQLARRLVQDLSRPSFEPGQFHDTYRGRVEKAAAAKAGGRPVSAEPRPATPAGVVDIMDALKASLARKAAGVGTGRKAPPRKRASQRRAS